MGRTKNMLVSNLNVNMSILIGHLRDVKELNWNKYDFFKFSEILDVEKDIIDMNKKTIVIYRKLHDKLVKLYKDDLAKKTGLIKRGQIYYTDTGAKKIYRGIQFVEKQQPNVIWANPTAEYYKTMDYYKFIENFKQKKFLLKK